MAELHGTAAGGGHHHSEAGAVKCVSPIHIFVFETKSPSLGVTVTPRLIGSNPLEQYLRDY